MDFQRRKVYSVTSVNPFLLYNYLLYLSKNNLFQDDRLEFLKLVIDDKMPHMQRQFESQDLNIISKRTSGFVAADLIKLTDKALFESWQRKGSIKLF